MSRPMDLWDDERIERAYRIISRTPVPVGLVESTVSAVRASGAVRSPGLSLRNHTRLAVTGVAGVAAGVALAVVLAGSLAMRPAASPSNSAITSASASASPSASRTAAPSGRYPGGIPRSLGGEPVFLGLGAVFHAAGTTDATPFLVGGWFGDGSLVACTGGVIGFGTDPLTFTEGCPGGVGGDSPWGTYSFAGMQGRMAWTGQSLPGGVGPSIVRVHTHDPEAADCAGGANSWCQAVLVVDAVLWTGDASTAASPISVAQAVSSLDGVRIEETLPMAGRGTLVVQQHVFPTVRPQTCPAPWPLEVFDLHGDPRFALLAVFPDEAARVAAQPLLDSAASACAIDPRVNRPGVRTWVGVANVLVLVYGGDAADAAGKALANVTSPTQTTVPTIGFLAASLDESYGVVVDSLAARLSGSLADQPNVTPSADIGAGEYLFDVERRYLANALSYSVGPAQTPTEASVGSAAWAVVAGEAVPGTAKLFEVDHPASTDPALRREVYVAYLLKQPKVDTWALLLVNAAPWPASAP